MFPSMTIKARLSTLVLLLLSLLVAGTLFTLREINEVGKEFYKIADDEIPLSQSLAKVNSLFLGQAINFERVMRFSTSPDPGDENSLIPSKEARHEFDKLQKDMLLFLKKIDKESHGSKTIDSNTLSASISDIQAALTRYEERARLVFQYFDSGEIVAAEIEALTIAVEEQEIKQGLYSLINEVNQRADLASQRVATIHNQALFRSLLMTFLGLILGLILASLIAGSITRPLGIAMYAADRIADGEESLDIQSAQVGELGKLIDTMNNLASSVSESKKELKNQAEELSRSNAELEQFAYIASHDLQEPLRMVSSYTQLLSRRYSGKLDESADEFISFAVDGVNRMQQLINDLLKLSRVGRDHSDFEIFSLQDALDDALKNLEVKISESGAKIQSPDKLPKVYGNRGQISQLFQNLISNGIKFCREKTPEIKLSAEQESDLVLISVKDNGIGIEGSNLDKVFDVFHRLHSKEEYKGTGIGLAICKKIAEHHGGSISATSDGKSGSTFTFSLRLKNKSSNSLE